MFRGQQWYGLDMTIPMRSTLIDVFRCAGAAREGQGKPSLSCDGSFGPQMHVGWLGRYLYTPYLYPDECLQARDPAQPEFLQAVQEVKFFLTAILLDANGARSTL